MAGAGYKLFNTGDVLTAQQVNEYLMQQTVMVFADASARTTALSGVLAEGMLSYLQDTNATEVYNGSAWVALAADQTPLTTKGDLFTYTTADARLASSNVDGDVLTVDTSTASGLKWAAPAGGGLVLISEQTASAVTSLSFSSIPSTYKALVFTWHGIYHSTTGSGFGLRLNNDSSANYSVNGHKIYNYTNQTSEADVSHLGAADVFAFGVNITSSTNRVRSAKGTLTIYDYASTSKYKYCRLQTSHFEGTGSGTNHLDVDIIYPSTSAISSIDIFRNTGSASFSNMTNTSIRLYGLS